MQGHMGSLFWPRGFLFHCNLILCCHQIPADWQGSIPPRLFTVGRLDVNSWGLLLVTNDGKWAHRIAHPSSEVTKEYLVRVNETPTKQQLKTVSQGCDIDGRQVSPVAVWLEERTLLRIVVSDGRNREVRRILEHAELEARSLKRVRIGGYRMPRDLKIGQFRELNQKEAAYVHDRRKQLLMQSPV